NLLSGTKTLYLSASGNVILGGSAVAGGHDIVIGVKAISGGSNASWNSTFWGAGLRVDTLSVSAYSGAVAARGQGKVTWTKQIKGKNAPIYFVSPGQINALVPFATTGPTATIVVQNGGANSNTVTAPVAATSPGVYSLDSSGTGSGAILHTDFTLVNDDKPAVAGETVLI